MGPSGEADVSRETIRRQVFGGGYELAAAYEEILRTDGVERGLVGPREAGRMWDRHVLNCAVIAPAFPHGVRVVDLGSGAGLPGLVLAIVRPDLSITLLEPLLRRATFLEEVVERLGLDSVAVLRARAEDAQLQAEAVTARAVAPLDRLAVWALPLVSPGGSMLAMKGAKAEEELAAAAPALPGLGASGWSVETYGEGIVSPPVQLVRVVRSTTPDRRARTERSGRRGRRDGDRRSGGRSA